jgi:hypothetical protein
MDVLVNEHAAAASQPGAAHHQSRTLHQTRSSSCKDMAKFAAYARIGETHAAPDLLILCHHM